MMSNLPIIGLALSLTLLINIPFGYWRRQTEKLSKEWFIAIHSPIPIVLLFRWLAGASFSQVPIFVAFFFLGQYIGGRLFIRYDRNNKSFSKCMILDTIKILKKR